MSKGSGQGAVGREQRGSLAALVFLLFFCFFFAGCLGESNTDPPTLPPGVTNISSKPGVSSSPSAASFGNILYMVWAEGDDAGINEIFLARSNNGGASFQTFQVSNTSNFSGSPKMAISNNGSNIIHVVWEEFIPLKAETDIFYSRAEDINGNLNFGAPQNLSISDPVCGPPSRNLPCPSQVPTIATFNNHVFVAWMESTDYVPPIFSFAGSTFKIFNSDIMMVRSSNHGVNFNITNPETLSLPNTGFGNEQSPSQNPSLAAANGHLFITWGDNLPVPLSQTRESKILFRSLEISSLPPVYTPDISVEGLSLSNPIVEVSQPKIAAEGNNVYLILEGTDTQGGDSEIFFRQAVGPQAVGTLFPFLAPINISNNIGRSKKGRIAVSGLDIFISWEDTSAGVPLVLLRDSLNGGTSFGETQTLISSSNTIGNSAITASNTTLFTFWEDALFGNFEIFFSRRQ